ncbi:MAG: putative molybdenum carrier protein [Methyloceanibacter sp.]
MLKIVSGGQTGVDRAALDAAIEKGIAYAGWCPKGGWAEDLPNPPGVLARYDRLQETPFADPKQRTEWNVRDSDRLMVLLDRRRLVSSGTKYAIVCADELRRPLLVIDLDAGGGFERAVTWLCECEQMDLPLCIAGPRDSEAPGIYAKARDFLDRLFASFGEARPQQDAV